MFGFQRQTAKSPFATSTLSRGWAFGLLLCLFVGAGQLYPVVAARGADEYRVGSWSGRALFDDNGKFDGCIVVRRYGDIQFVISLEADFDLAIGLKHDEWQLQNGDLFTGEFQVDQGRRRHARGMAHSNVVTFLLKQERQLIEEIKKGNSLHFKSGTEFQSFDLTGSAKALQRANKCRDSHLAKERQAKEQQAKRKGLSPDGNMVVISTMMQS